MVSRATFDSLMNYARAGSFGHNIEFTTESTSPEIGTDVLIKWNFSECNEESGRLLIDGKEELEVTVEGFNWIPVRDEVINAHLMVAGHKTSLRIHPQISIPSIVQFDVCSCKGKVGEVLSYTWKTSNTNSCLLVIDDGGRVEEIPVESSGTFDYSPTVVGNLIASLVVKSRHASLTDKAIVASVIKTKIMAPKLQINIPVMQFSAQPNEAVRFNWFIKGAKSISFNAPARGLSELLSPTGFLEVVMGFDQERFEIVITDFNGKEYKKALKVVPSFELPIPNELLS